MAMIDKQGWLVGAHPLSIRDKCKVSREHVLSLSQLTPTRFPQCEQRIAQIRERRVEEHVRLDEEYEIQPLGLLNRIAVGLAREN